MRTGHRALSDEDDKRAESKRDRPIGVLPSAVPPRAVRADAIPLLEAIIDIALRADLDTITFIAHADRQWDKTTLDKPI